ncbi:F-box domain, cyclin-like protein [Metarhizium album ARSEF 1941]|uniref:F-box domain, cyclin-like protein n=1 Tax=Metarhizium album (strain ARSEF 1941) TaxID=1081103 RepID=A0A0B2WYQ4_METAS|nr:F-box domain, cyclin-like protein [Metarhizium album ARSEF 1941]KHN98704.1 F-box domain, cyclin-like protein [Metarhizium album ARSEF 1941]
MEKHHLLKRNSSFERHTRDAPRKFSPFEQRLEANAPAVPVLTKSAAVAKCDADAASSSTLGSSSSAPPVVKRHFWVRKLLDNAVRVVLRQHRTVVTKNKLAMGSYRAPSLASSLMTLPDELLLQIMHCLPAPSLYCLRQTSARFMGLFDAQNFKEYHESQSSGKHKGFKTIMLRAAEKNLIANSLHRHMYCAACLAAEERGILAERLEALRTLRNCVGCNRLHATALFFPNDENVLDRASQTCIGRLGHITLCDHASCNPTSWQDLHSSFRYGRADYLSVCTHRSHRTKREEEDEEFLCTPCAFPRLYAKTSGDHDTVFELGYGWDLPLLQMDHSSGRVSLAAIRETLCSLVLNAFHNHRLCPHISAGEEIRNFVHNGICKCFSHDYLRHSSAKCRRQATLDCRVCGAVYMWRLEKGLLSLSLRYLWRFQQPTSFAWLNLLDKRFRERLFTDNNRHVLWCDNPDCRTNKRCRWEALVKENVERAYIERIGEDSGCWDYEETTVTSMKSSFQNW